MKYKILVHHPNGEKPTLEYEYEDLGHAEEGMGYMAVWQIKVKDGVRRTFEIVPAPAPEEVKDDTNDSPSGADTAGE